MRFLAATLLVAVAACGGEDAPPGTFRLPFSAIDDTATAYIAEVVAAPPGADLVEGAGEHVLIRNHVDIRIDMGGWWIEDGDGNRLPLGIGRQIDVDAELRVHTGRGQDSETAVFAGLNDEALDDDGDTLRLLDSAGATVMEFTYGD